MIDWDAYNEGDLLWLGDWSPTWLVILGLIGVAVIALSAYDLRSLARWRRWTLVSLRGAVYGLAVLLLLEPAVDLKQVTKVDNDVAVLVDTSRTMSLRADEKNSRYDRVRTALDQFAGIEDQLREDHNLHFYRFDRGTEPAPRGALEEANPDGGASNLTGALETVADEFGTGDLGGVVVFSDGIDTGAIGRRVGRDEKLDRRTLSLLDDLDAPINGISAASSEGITDVAISEVEHDDFAFVHNKTSVDVELQVVGLGR